MTEKIANITFETSDDDIYISVAKNIILNSVLPLEIRIMQLISAVPRKEIVLKSIEQLYASNQFDVEDYLVLLETFS